MNSVYMYGIYYYYGNLQEYSTNIRLLQGISTVYSSIMGIYEHSLDIWLLSYENTEIVLFYGILLFLGKYTVFPMFSQYYRLFRIFRNIKGITGIILFFQVNTHWNGLSSYYWVILQI